MNFRPNIGFRSVVLLAGALSLAVVLGLWFIFQSGGTTTSRPPSIDLPNPNLILAVDDGGAIVAASKSYVGFSSKGAVVWTDSSAATAGPLTSCAPTCPAAVLSSSVDALNAPEVPDPRPHYYGGTTVRLPNDYKSHLLVDSGSSRIEVRGSDGGQASIVVVTQGATTTSVPVLSADTLWNPGSDGRSGIISVPDGNGLMSSVYPARLEHGRWSIDAVRKTTSPFGCGDVTGRIIVSAPSPTLISGRGRMHRIPGISDGGSCALGKSGGIVVQYSQTSAAVTSKVVVINAAGESTWSAQVTGEARVDADPSADRYLVTVAGSCKEISASGKTIRTFAGVDDAKFTPKGRIVLAKTKGGVEWLSR